MGAPNFSNVGTITIGGRVWSTENLKTLYFHASAGVSRISSLGDSSTSTAGFQTGATETLKIRGILPMSSGTAACNISFGYADADSGIDQTLSVSPAGEVYFNGAEARFMMTAPPNNSAALGSIMPLWLDIPSSKWALINNRNGTNAIFGWVFAFHE